MKPVILTNNF